MSRDNQETIFDLQTGFVPGANQLINDGPDLIGVSGDGD
jgi:hypothetical protein